MNKTLSEKERLREAVIVAAESYYVEPSGQNFTRLRRAVEANLRFCGVDPAGNDGRPTAATSEETNS